MRMSVRFMLSAALAVGLFAMAHAQERIEDKKAELENLAKKTKAGTHFPRAQVPMNLTRFRQTMLAIGNVARRDPNFRKNNGARYALDFGGNTVQVESNGVIKEEKIFKNNKTAPYFKDLVLHPALNKAAQFHAEYMAANKKMVHEGPSNHNGADMSNELKRATFFAFKVSEGIAEAVSMAGASAEPEGWAKSDSHFRPWFNIGANVREIGLGAAKGDDGYWYYCGVFPYSVQASNNP